MTVEVSRPASRLVSAGGETAPLSTGNNDRPCDPCRCAGRCCCSGGESAPLHIPGLLNSFWNQQAKFSRQQPSSLPPAFPRYREPRQPAIWERFDAHTERLKLRVGGRCHVFVWASLMINCCRAANELRVFSYVCPFSRSLSFFLSLRVAT